MRHKDEVKYWADHPDGTKVWVNDNAIKTWCLKENVQWLSGFTYIVDDSWAELRKAQHDGKQLQCENEIGIFQDSRLSYWEMKNDIPSAWRIKPDKPRYAWQWLWQDNSGEFHITKHYETEKLARENICKSCMMIKYYPSIKEIK